MPERHETKHKTVVKVGTFFAVTLHNRFAIRLAKNMTMKASDKTSNGQVVVLQRTVVEPSAQSRVTIGKNTVLTIGRKE